MQKDVDNLNAKWSEIKSEWSEIHWLARCFLVWCIFSGIWNIASLIWWWAQQIIDIVSVGVLYFP